MTRLMRTSELTKRPVVTMAGDDIAQVKDIVYAADGGSVHGFTLAGRGLFAGPLSSVLPWSSVSALGADAVMVADESILADEGGFSGEGSSSDPARRDVLGSRVLTDTGTDLGQVVDVIVQVQGARDQCDVVGYEIESSEALDNAGQRVLMPLPDTMAASGEHLIVPASATKFVRHDLAGFGAAVDDFRQHLEGRD
ncbi:MAG: PRC-barrel domain-containing protein [Micrococcales bacterium]|nr:PRC-barrel domain-containing protein [Micrococcales bacterium]